MIEELIKKMRAGMEKAVKNFEAELAKIRTGRASTAILDGIRVDYYGTPTALNQVASLSTPEPKMIVIQPWETPILKAIETAIQKSDLNVNPINDGKVIRIKLPDLTEERRKDLAKVVRKIAEESRVAVRMSRRDANDGMKALLKDKKITEDENKRSEVQIQKVTDDFNKKIDELTEKKEKELMAI